MNLSAFDFNLPDNLIAQHPSQKRDHSKLLIANRESQKLEHKHFYDIYDEFGPNDVLVLNNTKVIPARLLGIKAETEAAIEVLLLKELHKDEWEALVKPAKRVKIGTKVHFGNGLLVAECIGVFDEGIRHFKMHYEGLFIELLEKLGTMPLPPYITERLNDASRYQTVYAKHDGSAAAPTAGLHFTEVLLNKIREKGVTIIPVTLHVGLGTFRPVSVDEITTHHMHKESYEITEESAKQLNQALKDKKRIIAVGTTTIRTLESNITENGFIAGHFDTQIFIYPGYKFKAVDALITNFHLPKSTLFMLVSALSSLDFMQKAYQEAIKHEYRFFSFGDAMFIK